MGRLEIQELTWKRNLETNDEAEGDAQIVVSAAVGFMACGGLQGCNRA